MTKKNQLFKVKPPKTICDEILTAFGLANLDDNHLFSRRDLEKMGCVEKIASMKAELTKYYIPCKARTYLNDITSKNVITILRQIVKVYGYRIVSREKYIKGEKFIIYQILPNEVDENQENVVKEKSEEEPFKINFS
jgi:hypothetical protein